MHGLSIALLLRGGRRDRQTADSVSVSQSQIWFKSPQWLEIQGLKAFWAQLDFQVKSIKKKLLLSDGVITIRI